MAIDTRNIVYLDNAATTMKKPKAVIDSMLRWSCSGNAGRGSHKLALAASEKIYECREMASKLFGCSSQNVIFTSNATMALNIAIKGCIQSGSHIITSDFEHNSVRRPILRLCRENQCSRSVFVSERSESVINNIERLITKETAAVVCIHRSNITGRTNPVEKIGRFCREKGLLFIVDASQSAGNADIDIVRDNIDILCTAGHKGLYGPQGTGLLILNEGIEVKPFLEGGSGTDSVNEDMPLYYPDRLEAGTISTAAVAGLCEGIRFVIKNGVENIHKRECELWHRCRNSLDNRKITVYDDNMSGANLLFNIKGMTAAEVATALDKKGICTRSGLHCAPDAHNSLGIMSTGAVRASFSYFTDEKEIDYFVKQVSNLI